MRTSPYWDVLSRAHLFTAACKDIPKPSKNHTPSATELH